MINEIFYLLKKELTIEWRQKYAIQSIFLYMGCAIFICYLAIGIKGTQLMANTWNSLFWIVLLFAALNASSKSFMQEDKQRNLYYYYLVSPQSLILSKIIYNTFIINLSSILGFVLYITVMGNPIDNMAQYLTCLALGASGFASTFTLLSAIAAKAANNTSLLAIMSIPLIMPLLMIILKFAKNALDGLDWAASSDELYMLVALNLMMIALSYLLFPILWRT
jgi:heme exporter protein B